MTPENQRLHCAELMDLASESLGTAQDNLAIPRLRVVVTQSYYAMFYAASALLAARDIHRRRHRGVISAFREHFCKTGVIDTRFGLMLDKAFDMRVDCDYKVGHRQGRAAAEAALERAREFVQTAEERLKTEPGEREQERPEETRDGPDA